MRSAWRDPHALLRHLGLDPARFGVDAESGFDFLVTQAFAARMRPGDPDDPLLRQVLSTDADRQPAAGFTADAVGDGASRARPGLLHKYAGRALLVTTAACPIHCRYCFRRQFDYGADQLHRARLESAVDWLAERPEITEIILSGGDPLMLGDRRLTAISDALARLPQLKRLRIHSRVPITLPARIEDELVEWLAQLPWSVVMVVHANHAREFDEQVGAAISRLRAAAVTVFNQAVLLAGVNDDVESLAELMETGFDAGVIPYYLHVLDRVAGAAHFETSGGRGPALIEALRRRLPGYLVPRLVRERAGTPYKLPVL
jgi:EF-P beta-lysylation protein EpmB